MGDVSGIYTIRNKMSGRTYVGSSENIPFRWAVHRYQLRKGTHHSAILQLGWKKYGEDAFVFTVIEAVANPDMLFQREQHWIDTLEACSRHKGYNVNPRADGQRRRKWTLAERLRASATRKGRKLPPRTDEHRKKISIGNRGKKRTLEALRRMSAAKKGRPVIRSLEHQQKLTMALKNRSRCILDPRQILLAV